MNKYILAITAFLLGLGIMAYHSVFANTSTIDLSTLLTFTQSALSGDKQLLMVSNGQIDVVPNSGVVMVGGTPVVNIGDQTSYANPNGIFNFYRKSTTSQPILGISSMCDTSSYCQGLFIQNLNSSGSGDLVFADDKGSATSSTHYFNAGIANSTQSDSDHTLILPYDGYIYNQGSTTVPVGMIFRSNSKAASTSITMSIGMQQGSPSVTWDQYGHTITHGAKGTLSGCTGGTLSTYANDKTGTINFTGILSLGSCVYTFANPYPTGSEVNCSITSKSNITLGGYSTTNAALTFGGSVGLGGGALSYQCEAAN